MSFTILIWLSFLVGVGYVINRWGTDGGNAIWLIVLALITIGGILGLFFPGPH
jgi:hypothetical protein